MSVFKKIDVNDNSITPFNVYKDYNITPLNHTGSYGYGVQFLSGVFHSHSFGDPINGVHINNEATNPNGTYKAMIWDSVNHLYYQRADKPSENFGGNIPEKETRDLQNIAHVISIPSTLFDLRIKPESVNITDGYIRSIPITYERAINTTQHTTVYNTPVALVDHYKFETSTSRYTNSVEGQLDLIPARPGDTVEHMVITGSGKVGSGSMLFKVPTYDSVTVDNVTVHHNTGNGIRLKHGSEFKGTVKTPEGYWGTPAATTADGIPAYNITMWVKPPDPISMPNGVTKAPGVQHLITRDRNTYFELNILTGSLQDNINNPKKLLPLQMFWGATGSNCTTSESRAATAAGFGLAAGEWNLISLQQEFWPGVYTGTSGSQYEQLPPWGHSAAKTTLHIYRPDEDAVNGYTHIKRIGYATASRAQPHWTNLPTRAISSSAQHNRSCYIGASGSVSTEGDLGNSPTSNTIFGAFTGSIDDVRYYESALTDTHIDHLFHNPSMDLRYTPPVTASFNIIDDGYGNLIDTAIISSSFLNSQNLVGYYGFNELYTVKNRTSSSSDLVSHQGLGKTIIKDYSTNKNDGVSDKVKFIPGIAVQQQSGSSRSAESTNYYQTDIPTGIRASFNNSGSVKIPHISDLNLDTEDGFTISFWIKIPENQIPGINTITGSGALYPTTGMGGNAGGTSAPCVNYPSGSTAGRDYVTLITKSGLISQTLINAATGEVVPNLIQGIEAESNYPYHIELKNTSREKDGKVFEPGNGCPQGAPLNTIVIRRKGVTGAVFLESKSSLVPLIENHVVIIKSGTSLEIWINGKLDSQTFDNLECTANNSDIFLGDNGKSWVTGSNLISSIESNFISPKNPFSGSLDEIRFYNTPATAQNVLSLYDNNLNSPTAYQSNKAGNVFYEHGIVTLTNNHLIKYFSGSLHQGTATIGNSGNKFDSNGQALFSNKFNLKFKNTRELYEQKILCKAKASDFNLSTNPTLRKTTANTCGDILSVQELADFATKPEFNPYITTIGLYDDYGRLLAIAKLAKPVPKLKNVDMTFVVKFDR